MSIHPDYSKRAAFGLVVWLGLCAGSVLAEGRSLAVTVDYTGSGSVDEQHKIYVQIFDSPQLDMRRRIGLRIVTENHATVTFSDVSPDTVYLFALYDQHASVISAAGPNPQSPVAVYGESLENPQPIRLNQTSELSLRFGESLRLADVMPQQPPQPVNPRLDTANGIVEIRMYKIKPGMRDAFVKFFEEKTLAPQGEVGMRVLGQFRSLVDENTFVWIRAFRSHAERQKLTLDFYGSKLWTETLSKEALAMIDSTEVLLVEPTAESKLR